MALAQLDGPKHRNWARIKSHERRVSGNELGKINLKKFVKKVATGIKTAVKKVASVAASPARIAFLGLVDINMFQLAKSLAKAWTDHNEATKSMWKKLGGDPSKLVKSINTGAHSHLSGPFQHRDHHHLWIEMIHPRMPFENKSSEVQVWIRDIHARMNAEGHYIGAAPAAAAAAATPILVAVLAFLKGLKGADGKPIVDPETANKINAAAEAGAEALGQDPGSYPVNEQQVAVLPTGQYAQAGIIKPILGPYMPPGSQPVLLPGEGMGFSISQIILVGGGLTLLTVVLMSGNK